MAQCKRLCPCRWNIWHRSTLIREWNLFVESKVQKSVLFDVGLHVFVIESSNRCPRKWVTNTGKKGCKLQTTRLTRIVLMNSLNRTVVFLSRNQRTKRAVLEATASSNCGYELPKFLMPSRTLSLKTRGSQWISVTEDKYRKIPRPPRLVADTLTIFWDVIGTVQSQPQLAHPVTLSGNVKHWKSWQHDLQEFVLAWCRLSSSTAQKCQNCRDFTVLYHQSQSRYLVPSDFHRFPDSRNISEDITLRQAMKLFRQGAQFCRDGCMTLLEHWRKCVDGECDYVET